MENVLVVAYDLFLLISQTARMLNTWFFSPIEADLAELFGLPLTATNIDVIFMSGVVLALVTLCIKLFNPFS